MNSFEVQLLAIIHVCALCDLCAKESFLKKAFCLVHTRKQGAIKPISLFYVNALNASFTMAYFLRRRNGIRFRSWVSCSLWTVLQWPFSRGWGKEKEGRKRGKERGHPSSHPIPPRPLHSQPVPSRPFQPRSDPSSRSLLATLVGEQWKNAERENRTTGVLVAPNPPLIFSLVVFLAAPS